MAGNSCRKECLHASGSNRNEQCLTCQTQDDGLGDARRQAGRESGGFGHDRSEGQHKAKSDAGASVGGRTAKQGGTERRETCKGDARNGAAGRGRYTGCQVRFGQDAGGAACPIRMQTSAKRPRAGESGVGSNAGPICFSAPLSTNESCRRCARNGCSCDSALSEFRTFLHPCPRSLHRPNHTDHRESAPKARRVDAPNWRAGSYLCMRPSHWPKCDGREKRDQICAQGRRHCNVGYRLRDIA